MALTPRAQALLARGGGAWGGRARRGAACGLLAAALGACEAEEARGTLVVAVSSELTPPRDLDALRIEVSQGGQIFHSVEYLFDGEPGFRLPATLAISARLAQPLAVRAVALRGGQVRVLREVRTALATERTAMARLHLSWLCAGRWREQGGELVSDCASAQETCEAGGCVDAQVSEAALEEYRPQAVFGGGSAAGEGACFDALGCFELAQLASDLRAEDCSVALPTVSGGAAVGVNVAVLGAAGSEGVCATNACLLVLDRDTPWGWREQAGRVLLPPALCASGRVLVTSTACSSKSVSLPTCGPWSSTAPGGAGHEGLALPGGLVAGAGGSGGQPAAGGAGQGGMSGSSG